MNKLPLAFDIGANIGKYTEVLLQHYNAVVAVEPMESHCHYISRRLSGQNLVIVNALVSDKQGSLPFYECDTISTVVKEWVENSRFTGDYTWQTPKLKPAITIKNLIDEYGPPDFIKIDVEGHEFEVLSGLTACDKNQLPHMLAFEWAEELVSSTEKCIKLLKELGYDKFGVCHMHDTIPYNPEWVSSESVYRQLSTLKSPGSKHHWGMIWAMQ